MISQVLAET